MAEKKTNDQEFLEYVVKTLVDHPEDLSIEERNDQDATILVIHANQEDIGKIIGKSGRIIRALRDLMKVIAAKRNIYVDVEIHEDLNPHPLP